MRKVFSIFLPLALLATSPATAQTYPCWINSEDNGHVYEGQGRRTVTPPDLISSQTWEQLGAANDARALQALAGTWLTQTQAQGSTLQTYETFEPNGLYQYSQNVCNSLGCNPYQGAGEFRAAFQGDGSIFFMMNYSDLQRSHQCVSNQVSLRGPGLMINRYGAAMRRVN